MGYRSEVAIALRKNDYEDLKNFAKHENREDVTKILEKGEMNKLPCSDNNYIILYWDWIKWYGDEISFIDEFLKNLEDKDDEAYEFICIGEDYSDAEQLGAGEYIWLNRSIGYIGGHTQGGHK